MQELMEALRNNGSFTILCDIIKQGYAKREKGTERAKTIPIMLENGLIEEVEPTEEMMKYIRFSDEQHKQDYINIMYFLNITEKGRLVFELLKLWREAQKEGIKQVEQARFDEQRRIAKSLLNTIGIDIDDITENEASTMKQKLILAVERANLTEQDEVRILDMDGTEYGTEKLFKNDLSQALADRIGKIKAIIGTFAEWVKYARENVDFKPNDYITINVEIDY